VTQPEKHQVFVFIEPLRVGSFFRHTFRDQGAHVGL